MKQRISRKHTRILLVTSLLLVGMIPLFFLLHSGLGTTAHAQGTPTVSSSYTKVHYGDLFTVTAKGFAAGETTRSRWRTRPPLLRIMERLRVIALERA